jgi:hypothetical protein
VKDLTSWSRWPIPWGLPAHGGWMGNRKKSNNNGLIMFDMCIYIIYILYIYYIIYIIYIERIARLAAGTCSIFRDPR